MKKCLGCGEVKPLSEYHFDKSRKTGLREKCKRCRCKYEETVERKCLSCDKIFIAKGNGKNQKYCGKTCQRVFIRFKISGPDYIKMLKDQKNKCAICGEEEKNIDKRTGKKYNLSIDHCHKSGKVRGLLCTSCNNGIGHFKENISLIKKAIDYIIKFQHLKTNG